MARKRRQHDSHKNSCCHCPSQGCFLIFGVPSKIAEISQNLNFSQPPHKSRAFTPRRLHHRSPNKSCIEPFRDIKRTRRQNPTQWCLGASLGSTATGAAANSTFSTNFNKFTNNFAIWQVSAFVHGTILRADGGDCIVGLLRGSKRVGCWTIGKY